MASSVLRAASTTTVGDPPGVSFEEYVRSRSDRLVRLACLVTRDWEEARDAVQDALVSLCPRWDQLDPVRLDAYVNRTVTNACLMRLRRVRRIRPVASPSALPETLVVADPAAAFVVADEAWQLCGELPAAQRTAVVLRFYQDLSYAQIGDVLGCPETTARSHVHRALVALRERHGGEDNHG